MLSKKKNNIKKYYDQGFRVDENGVVRYPSGELFPEKIDSRRKGYKTFINNSRSHQLAAYQKFKDKWLYSNLLIRHLDGNCRNNRLENLSLGTIRDNALDIPEHIRKINAINMNLSVLRKENHAKAMREKCAKFSNEDVWCIRKLYSEDVSQKYISQKYNVSQSTIHKIVTKKVYKDI